MVAQFIGIALDAREVLVDAGARGRVGGMEQLRALAIELEELGLPPRWVQTGALRRAESGAMLTSRAAWRFRWSSQALTES